MHDDAARVCVVEGAYFLAQSYEGCSPGGDSVVRPRREVKLFDVPRLSILVSNTGVRPQLHLWLNCRSQTSYTSGSITGVRPVTLLAKLQGSDHSHTSG